jgi:hypothetical protein
MIYFAIFTAGYFVGVFTFLAIFPPRTKEIEEQEKNALDPILRVEEEKEAELREPLILY